MSEQDTNLQEEQTTVIDDTEVEVTGELDLEVGEKPDAELEEHSKKVQKRIDKLTYEAREAQRQQTAAEGVRDEAILAAKSLHGRNQEYERIISTGEAQLVSRIKNAAETSVNFAKSKYQNAIDAEDEDTEATVEALNSLTLAQAELIEANRYDHEYQQRVANFAAQQQWAARQPIQPQVQQPAQVQQPTPEANEWAKKNTWFNNPEHYDMTAMAYGVHEDLVRNKGFTPDTDKYYAEIDKVIRQRFPEHFDEAKPSTVVAPAQRTTGVRSRKVKITASAAAVAKQLGLSNEQYANQVLKIKGMT